MTNHQIPPGVADNVPEAALGSDSDAAKEAAAIAAGTLEEVARQKEHTRTERLRDHVSTAALALVWAISLAYIAAIAILAWHGLAPLNWRWLSGEDLATLKTFVFSSALTSAVGAYFIRRF